MSRVVVTLIGSAKFKNYFSWVEEQLILEGYIVLTPTIFRSCKQYEKMTKREKAMYRCIHREKIKMSDEVKVVNFMGYIDDDTRTEIDYAIRHGIKVTYLEWGVCYVK